MANVGAFPGLEGGDVVPALLFEKNARPLWGRRVTSSNLVSRFANRTSFPDATESGEGLGKEAVANPLEALARETEREEAGLPS